MKKLIHSTETQMVNTETGEMITIETSKTFSKKTETDKFYMTFIDFAAPLFNLKSDTAKSVLCWMCNKVEYNTGKVHLTTNTRRELCAELEISSNTLTNTLKKLKDLNLISGEKGDFIINPQILWKGDLQTRDSMLKLEEIKVTFDLKFKS